MKVVSVTPEGGLKGLHFDDFDLGQFGNKTVKRASEIFFNDMAQHWDVLLPNQYHPFLSASGFKSYEEARNFEVIWLQECAMRGIDAYSNLGEEVAGEIREGFDYEG